MSPTALWHHPQHNASSTFDGDWIDTSGASDQIASPRVMRRVVTTPTPPAAHEFSTDTGASTQLARKAADAYWGSGKSNDDPWPEPGAEEIRTMRECEALLAPGMRKHLLRLVHAEEWAASIAESHPDTPERTKALETHRREVDVIARAIGGRYPRGLARIGSAMGSERGGAVRERLGGLEVRWF